MMPSSKRASLAAKRRAANGTPILIQYTELPAGAPPADPTTGAVLAEPVTKTIATRGFVHFVAPIQSGLRTHAEIEAGDALVELPLDLVRVTNPGGTALEQGAIVDQTTFYRANFGTVSLAEGELVEASSLEGAVFIISNQKWVQKTVGEDLALSWDAIYQGINLSRAFVLRKA